MGLPVDIFHRTPEEAVHRIVLGFLGEAREARKRLTDPSDTEALHDFRVAIRRLRSTLRAWRKELRGTLKRRHAKRLRKLQRATGGGRDAEVALEWLGDQHDTLLPEHGRGTQWLEEHLAERLDSSMDRVRADLRRRFKRLAKDMRGRIANAETGSEQPGLRFGEAFATKARAHIQNLVKHLLRIESITDEDEAHEARIRCKRLRYLVEPVAGLLPEGRKVVTQCKRLQDVLGDLNDTRVLRDEMERVVGEAAAEAPEAPSGAIPAEEHVGLDEITRRLELRQRELHDKLQRGWLADGAASFLASVEALAQRVELVLASKAEIERKFLLREAPDMPPGAVVLEIEQGYLAGQQAEERLRRQRGEEGVRHLRTSKLGSGVERLEHEEEISAAAFDALWPQTEGRRVRKRRHVVTEGADVWEIDEFLDRELWLAEFNLETPDALVTVPAWLSPCVERDVTESGEYANRRLAQ